MFRWLTYIEDHAASEICTCRGEMEVMESRLLMSVNTISRMVEPEPDREAAGNIENANLPAGNFDEGGAWWI